MLTIESLNSQLDMIALAIAAHMIINSDDHIEFFNIEESESITPDAIADDLRDAYKMSELDVYADILYPDMRDNDYETFGEFIYLHPTIEDRIQTYIMNLRNAIQFNVFKNGSN